MSVLLGGRRLRGRLVTIAYLAIGVLGAVMFVGAPSVPLAGSLLGLALVLALAIGPIAVPLAVARPLIVPFALWAALVPFDTLFAASQFGPIGKLLGSAAAVAAIVSMFVRHRAVVPPLCAGAWGGFTLFAIVSLLWAENPAFGTTMAEQIAGLLLVGVIVAMYPADTKDLRALFLGALGGGVGASAYAIVTYALTGRSLHISAFGAPNVVVDHNHFGAALLLPLLCATVATISSRNLRRGLLCALAAAACVAGIAVSESRGALIAAGIGMAYILVRSPYRWRLLLPCGISAAVLAAMPGVFARFSDSTAGDGAGRFEVWNIGFAAFKHHWLAGSGFGTFKQVYQAAYFEVSQSSDKTPLLQDPHNLMVELAVELGIIGLALVLLAWWSQFRALRMISAASGGWADARIAMEATTIALFTMCLSLDLMTFKYTWLALTATWIVRSAYISSQAFAASQVSRDAAADGAASYGAGGARARHPLTDA